MMLIMIKPRCKKTELSPTEIDEMSRVARKPVFRVPTRSDTNRAVQPQKMARGLKFQIKEVEGSYYLCNENIGAVQLYSYCPADLCLCFCMCKKQVF